MINEFQLYKCPIKPILFQKMRIIFVLYIAFTSYFSYSQPVRPIIKNKNWEQWLDRVPVGAEFNVGIMALNPSNINAKGFFVNVPKIHDKMLCVSINSKDGRYKANLEYDITNLNVEGIYEFELPTIYKQKLAGYKENEVAIIVKSSLSCNMSIGDFYIACWKDFDNNEYSTIYLNSESTIVLAMIDKNNKREDIKCKKIIDTSYVSYNCECEVATSKLKNNKLIHLMKVVRSGGGSELKKHGEIKIKI
jgi:hypothetical protein